MESSKRRDPQKRRLSPCVRIASSVGTCSGVGVLLTELTGRIAAKTIYSHISKSSPAKTIFDHVLRSYTSLCHKVKAAGLCGQCSLGRIPRILRRFPREASEGSQEAECLPQENLMGALPPLVGTFQVSYCDKRFFSRSS